MIAAVVEPYGEVPRARIDTDAAAVYRADAAGVVHLVRGPVDAGVIYDYELPHDEPVTYRTAPVGGEESAPVQMPDLGLWLVPVASPSLAVRVWMAQGGFPGWTRSSPQAVVDIPGRSEAIAVTFARGARRGTLVVKVLDATARSALRAALADGGPILLSYAASRLTALDGVLWVAIGEPSEAMVGHELDPSWDVSLPLTEIARPEVVASAYVAIEDLVGAIGSLSGVITSLGS